ncbi:hypothetical protein SAMN05216388_105510 [Halorientalis persicus]|uniref:Uncharacterized protein n=1 Tax=Halorientalis persicus TaxID=1367881 RepID=A0A1H8WCQ1_9EURY|nr:DNA-binding protein [Halorientalis persicus]SEP25435.1 hypothetical protein SAMN05216388_105510 [Halorientalis persicus]
MSESDSPEFSRTATKRVLPSEFVRASHQFQEGSSERDPNYLLLPSGDKANRVVMVGTVTNTEDVATDSDSEYWQAEIVSPIGETVYAYAGQYQPEAQSVIQAELEPPAYVMVIGKPRTYEDDDGEIHVSVTPETIKEVDADLRDQWLVDACNETMDRIESFDPEDDEYDAMAADHHGADHSDIVDAVVETLDGEVESPIDAGAESEEAEDESEEAEEESLEEKGINELRHIASEVDGVEPTGDADTLIEKIRSAA